MCPPCLPPAEPQMLPPQTPLQTGAGAYPFRVTRVDVLLFRRGKCGKEKSFPVRSPPVGATELSLSTVKAGRGDGSDVI